MPLGPAVARLCVRLSRCAWWGTDVDNTAASRNIYGQPERTPTVNFQANRLDHALPNNLESLQNIITIAG